MYELANSIFKSRYAISDSEPWEGCATRVTNAVCGGLVPEATRKEIEEIIRTQKFIPGGRYLANAGIRNVFSNCLALDVDDSRQSWAKLLHDSSLALLLGTGIGVDYSKVRAFGSPISSGGTASGPISLMNMVNEIGRYVRCGGQRRSAILAQLHWEHSDVFDFIASKQLTDEQKKKRDEDYQYPTQLDMTNISVRLDDNFFDALYGNDTWASIVYDSVIDNMVNNGEPGFLVNSNDEYLTNACSEYRTSHYGEICNLGSLNLASINTIDDFTRVVHYATIFLMCGKGRSDLPFPDAKKKSIGLGIMGFHTWLAKRNYKYSVPGALHSWLHVYKEMSIKAAEEYSVQYNAEMPERLRCIAPSGTISLLGGLTNTYITSGIEPQFSASYIRRWYNNSEVQQDVYTSPLAEQYGTTQDSTNIDLVDRLEVLKQIQEYVDMSISVTINLPADSNTDENKQYIKETVLPYLPYIRGLTVYRDGSRGLSPLTPIPLEEALRLKHKQAIDYSECASGVCGT